MHDSECAVFATQQPPGRGTICAPKARFKITEGFPYFKDFMKIAVIGAGIIGITTAYELARDGHRVTVFEKTSTAAEGTSFANTGVSAPSMTLPFSIPAWPQPTRLHLYKSLQSVTLKKGISRQDLQWLWAWGNTAGTAHDSPNRRAAHTLASYSRDHMLAIANTTAFEFERSIGHFLIAPTEASHQTLLPTLSELKVNNVAYTELTPAQAIKLEPALGVSAPFHSAIHLPHDGAGNCRQFALLLRAEAQKYGVKFQFGTQITALQTTPKPTLNLSGAESPIAFDAIVACTGEFTEFLQRHVKIKLPMAAVHGYSVSASIREPLNAPTHSIMDTDTRVVIARLGNRIRVSGGAELGGSGNTKDPNAIQGLFKTLQRYFPGATQYPSGIQIWKGARYMTGDGLALIGGTDRPGIWLNLAHGDNGWGNACGAARLLANLINQKKPDVDATAFDPLRSHG